MQIRYSGPKKERLMQFPIPIMASSDIEGEVLFKRGGVSDVPNEEWAQQLLALAPEYFTVVPSTTPSTASKKG